MAKPARVRTPAPTPVVRYRPEFVRQAEKLALLGVKSDAKIADFFGVSKTAVAKWRVAHPEFFDAIRRGSVVADTHVATALFKRATGYKHKAVKIFMPAGAAAPVYAPYVEHYPPDTAAAVHWLNNRASEHWRTKQEVEVVKSVDQLSDEQLAALEMVLDLVPDGAGAGVHALPVPEESE